MSMKIGSARIRDTVLKGVPQSGPPSLKSRWARLRYQSPEGLGTAFNEAMKVIEQDSASLQAEAEKTTDKTKKEKLLAQSERHNPEVRFNYLVQSKEVDLHQPVYKMLAQRAWQQKPMLLLMQRLEQHHVIPDTLPTLNPQADVAVRFITPNMRFIEPGEWIVNDVCSRTPQISIRDFGVTAGESAKYTVLIVNPDTPDLERDRFSTWLNFAAVNVEASLASPIADFSKSQVAVPYIPPCPEKNAPAQRLCVWVFRQDGDLSLDRASLGREFFDIREFTAKHNLEPVGASLWRSKWDLSTPAVREKYGLGPGRVYYRARTAKPENALLHISERPKWMKVDGLE